MSNKETTITDLEKYVSKKTCPRLDKQALAEVLKIFSKELVILKKSSKIHHSTRSRQQNIRGGTPMIKKAYIKAFIYLIIAVLIAWNLHTSKNTIWEGLMMLSKGECAVSWHNFLAAQLELTNPVCQAYNNSIRVVSNAMIGNTEALTQLADIIGKTFGAKTIITTAVDTLVSRIYVDSKAIKDKSPSSSSLSSSSNNTTSSKKKKLKLRVTRKRTPSLLIEDKK
jgi:hypothetical protein